MKRRPLPPVREEVSNSKNWRNICDNEWVVYALVASVGALTYANSLNGEFVHDDIPAIVYNGDVTGASPVLNVFTNDFWGTPMSDPNSHKSYRPLTTLSFRVTHWVCGLSVWWWHAGNVSLHAACCVLVARTASAVARLRPPFATLAALLFAVHPVHTEAVSGVVGRADVLACVFFLSSVLVYHGGSGQPRVGASVALAALAMLAKEPGLTALLFNLAFDIYRCWTPRSRVKWRWKGSGVRARGVRMVSALVMLCVARLAVLQGALPAFSPQDNPTAFHPSFVVRLLTFWYLAALNWWLMLCPWTLSHDWQMGSVPPVGAADPRNLLTATALLALLALSYRCFVGFEAQRHAPATAALLLLALPYLPASNLLVTVGFVLAERVLYIPSVGSVLLTAYGVQLAWGRRGLGRGVRRAVAAAAALLVAASAARALQRNRDWRTRETLLRADLAVLPHNAKLHYNFANFLKDTDQHESAIKHYKEALRLWPWYASAHNNLGTLELGTGRAERHFLLALTHNRRHLNAHYNLARLYRKKNQLDEALKMLERCISLKPRFVQAHLELMLLKPIDEKKEILEKLLELEPNNWEHYILFGNWYKEKGLLPLSLHRYTSAMRLSLAAASGARRGRGTLASLRAACLALRAAGQRARALQLITRWHWMQWSGRAASARARAARAWQLRAELAGRARLYSRALPPRAESAATCLHHTHLQVSPEPYDSGINRNEMVNSDLKTFVSDCNVHSEPSGENGSDKIIAAFPPVRKTNDCKEILVYNTKKSVSISTQYKPIHNKSEAGHKQKSCPTHNQNQIKKPKVFAPFVSDHLIKTY